MPRNWTRTAILLMATIPARAEFESSVTTWPGGRTAALSLVFDDGRNDHRDFAAPMLTARGLPGTFALMPGVSWATKGPQFAAIAAQGHELASHTMLHQACRIQTVEEDAATPPANSHFHSLVELSADCTLSRAALDAIQPRPAVSFVYPGGTNTAETRAVIAQHFLAARLSTSGIQINPPTPPDMMQVRPVYVGGAQPTVTDWCDYVEVDGFFDAVLTTLTNGGGWAVEEYHDIECPGYAALDLDAWAGHLDELQAMAPVLWVASMGDVARYIAQRNAASFSVVGQGPGFVVIAADDGLNDAIFDLPITVETNLPAAWSQVKVSQGASPIPAVRIGDVVRYDILPSGNPVYITVESTWASCMMGPGVDTPCGAMDVDQDGDLDLFDFVSAQH